MLLKIKICVLKLSAVISTKNLLAFCVKTHKSSSRRLAAFVTKQRHKSSATASYDALFGTSVVVLSEWLRPWISTKNVRLRGPTYPHTARARMRSQPCRDRSATKFNVYTKITKGRRTVSLKMWPRTLLFSTQLVFVKRMFPWTDIQTRSPLKYSVEWPSGQATKITGTTEDNKYINKVPRW